MISFGYNNNKDMMFYNKKNLITFLLLIAALGVKAEWKDVTDYYISNPSFNNNQTGGWQWSSNAASQKADYDCFEFWNGTFDMSQNTFGTHKGHYRLSFQGFFRAGDFDAIYSDYLNGKETIPAYVRITDISGETTFGEKPIASVFSFTLDESSWDIWSADGVHFYPNQMSSASEAFYKGGYLNVIEFDADENFVIHIVCDEYIYSSWCIFDNFKLEYDGNLTLATSLSITPIKSEIYVGQSTTIIESLQPEDVSSRNLVWNSSDESVATVDNNGYVCGVGPGVVSITASTTDGSDLSASATITVKSVEGLNWVDVTDLYVANPRFDDDNTDGWYWDSNASSQTLNYGCFEFWNGTFNFYQILEGLKPGLYRLSMQGFYRSGEPYYAYPNYIENVEKIRTYIYAGGSHIPIKSIYSYSFDDYVPGSWTVSYEDQLFSYPDNMLTASNAFANGAYQNQLIFECEDEEDANTLINIWNEDYQYSNWCIFDNFKLEYCGNVVHVQSIDLSIDKEEIVLGETVQCKAVILPEEAFLKALKWSSSNENVATVDENGLVRGVGFGSCEITAAATDGSGVSASLTVRVVNSVSGPEALVFNEIMASNIDEFLSPAYNFDGWIEFYNPTNKPVSLADCHLSDDISQPTKWKMSSDMGVVPANGFAVIWFDSNDISSTNAPFGLDVDGGTLYLSDKNGKVLSSQTYPESLERVSYARKTDWTGEWEFCGTPTLGKSNNDASFASVQLAAPVVDQPSQLFVSPIVVNVTIPAGCTLRYTTDGTLPTMTNGSTSQTGQFTVSSTLCYRYRLFAEGMLPSRVTTRSFIFRDQDYTLPVVSVVSDPKFLYDNTIGVMVRGNNGRPGNGQASKCNWNMSWDRPVNFSYVTTDGEMVLNQDCNLEMCGGWSRAWTPHAFKLKGSKELGGDKNLPYPFFEDKPYIRNRTLQVRNGGNDNVCRIKDPALQYIMQSSGINIDCQSYQPVHEFINGRYIGVLNVREPNNKHYVYANYGWDDDEIDQFEMSPDSGYVQKCGTEASYLQLVDYLSADAANSDTYAEICKVLDIDEYVNYMAAEFYLCNWDWPQNNVKGFKKKEDGKYRFVLFDLDGAFSNGDVFNGFMNKEIYTFDQLYPTSLGRITDQIRFVTLFRNLLNNADFRKKFIDTYCLMGGSVFEADRVIAIVDQMAARVNPAMRLEGGSVNSTANSIKNFFNGRLDQANATLRNFSPFELYNKQAQKVWLSSDTENAQILVNGIQVPTGTFNGYLYQPMKLKAVAPAGYTFLGWMNGSGNGTEILSSGANWKYYDQGSLDGTNWTSPAYSENGWKSGRAPLGYGKDNIRTTIEYGDRNNKRPTAYFRTSFNMEKGPGSKDQVTLHFTVDDGFVVYINGSEVGRYNMPSGVVGYNTFASTYAPNNPDTGTLNLSPGLFHSGTNVIAVEVHNNSSTSTDLMWEMSLVVTRKDQSQSFYSTDTEIDLPDGDVMLTACYRAQTAAEQAEQNLHPVYINEISGSNDCYVNEYGKKGDWVELYNATDKDIDVAGMYLSDNVEKPLKYQISKDGTSANTIIPAHGHLLIWCDNQSTTSQALHASFKISGQGGCVLLTAADQSWTDVLAYSAHDGNSTVGRFPDGTQEVYLMDVPTIGKRNILTSSMNKVDQTDRIEEHEMMIASANGLRISYGAQHLIVKSEDNGTSLVEVFTADGRKVDSQTVAISNGATLVDVSHLPSGFYVARATDNHQNKVACKFLK